MPTLFITDASSNNTMASKDIKRFREKEEVEESTTSTKKQKMVGNDDHGDNDNDNDDSWSTDDFSLDPEEEVSSEKEMNHRRACYDDVGTSDSGNNDGDTSNNDVIL
jgi:hypothetical protein